MQMVVVEQQEPLPPHQQVPVEMVGQDLAVEVVVEEVVVVAPQALAAQEEQVANLLAAAAEVELQPTDQTLELVAQAVLV